MAVSIKAPIAPLYFFVNSIDKVAIFSQVILRPQREFRILDQSQNHDAQIGNRFDVSCRHHWSLG